MTAANVSTFSGLRPRIPESRLNPGEATIARNCDFAYGELRNTKGGFLLKTLSNTARSIYTGDGVTFFSWTSTNIFARPSPLVNDPHFRLYFTGDGAMKVTDRRTATINGGPPASTYLVGVPRPTTAPALEVGTAAPINSSTATLTFRFHWEYGGVKYQEAAITPTVEGTNLYQFTPPAKAESTPEQAFPVVHMTAVWIDSGVMIFDVYTGNSAFARQSELYDLDITSIAGGAYQSRLTQTIRESVKQTRAYVYTYVNIYDEEGPPSPPAVIDTAPGMVVAGTVVKDSVGGYAPIKEIRVYATPPTAEADYFMKVVVPALSGAGPFTFSDDSDLLDTPLESLEYYPPDPNMTGLISLPNGILAGSVGSDLYFSEPYRPWAWPPRYAVSLGASPVGAISHGAGVLVTTRTRPLVISGVSSDSMTASRINVDQAGVSPFAIAVVDGLVVYASNDGLVVVSGATGSLEQGQRFFTREVWRARYGTWLSSMRFAVWDGRLVVYSDTASFTAFMIRFDEADGTMTELPDFVAGNSFVSQLADQFYYVLSSGLYQFNGGSDQTAVWQSREEVLARPVNFGAAQALVEGSWAFELWAFVQIAGGAHEYQLMHTKTLTTGRTDFRLPSGYKSDRYRFKITGTGRFRELRLAETMAELAAV
jgi:hypothetical protein